MRGLCQHYSGVPGNRNWQIETAVWNLAGFLHCALQICCQAGSDLGSFLMIFVNNFLYENLNFLYENLNFLFDGLRFS